MVNRRERARITRGERCVRVWEALVEVAARRGTITYECLACATNVPFTVLCQGRDSMVRTIHDLCGRREWPFLNVLAVNMMSGVPGSNFPRQDVEDGYQAENERVYDFDWQNLPTPDPEDFVGD